MSAVDDIINLDAVQIPSCGDLYKFNVTLQRSIKELAEDQANTDELAHAVAGWAEQAQDRCGKLEERVKALEDEHNNILRALTAERALMIDYTKAFHIDSPLPEEDTSPAPDLDALISRYDKKFEMWAKGHLPEKYAEGLLRAFAAELGVK